MSLKINWEIDDGYVSGSRPQSTRISEEDLLECETEEQVREMLEESVEDDFRNHVNWCFSNLDELLEAWRSKKKSRA